MLITIDFSTKRANADKWKTQNPVLRAGQFGYEKDTGQLKIGDGISTWNDLPYIIRKNNLTAMADPTPNDCAGYSVGSIWFNHLFGTFWVCKANTGTVAAWTKMASGYGY